MNYLDFLKFQLDAGDHVTIDIDASEFGSGLDSILRLFDSTGNQISVSDDTSAPGESSSVDSYIDYTASSSGTYYIGVSSYSNFDYDPFTGGIGGSSSGNYTINIAVGSGSSANQITLNEPNNTILQAVDTGLSSANPGTVTGSGLIRTSTQNPVTVNNGTVTASLGTLNSGESATVNLTVLPFIAGDILSTTNVTSNEYDYNPSNNSLISTKAINAVTPANADLELTQTVSNSAPQIGDQVTFNLTLTNKGPGTATAIKVRDILPAGLSYVSSTAVLGSYDSNTGIWDVGNMPYDASIGLAITAIVNAGQSISNTAEVITVAEVDPDSIPNNNSLIEDDLTSVNLDVQNETPVAQSNKTLTVLEDTAPTPLNISAPTDANGDTLSITVVTVPITTKGEVRLENSIIQAGDTLTIQQLTSLVFAPLAKTSGTAGTFSYTVNDGQGGITSQTVTLEITPVGNTSTIDFSSTNFSVSENGTPISAVTVIRTGTSNGDEASVTITLNNGSATSPADYNNTPIVVNFADNEITKTISIPVVNDALYETNETINLTLSNPTGGAEIGTQATATLAIVNDDALAVANPLPVLNAAEDAVFSFTLPDNLFNADTNINLNYTATLNDGSALPAWLSFNSATRTFSGTPANPEVGSLNITVTATTPDGASASTPLNLVVTNTNDAPVVANPLADQTTPKGLPFNFTIPANTFSDVDAGDNLTYTATLSNGTPLPAWLSFNPATQTFNGTPPTSASNLSLNVTASDRAGASVSSTFGLTLLSTPPVLDLNGSVPGTSFNTTFTEDRGAIATLSSGLTLTDADSPTVTSATITITNLLDGSAESLSVPSTVGAITATYSAATGTLQLTGTATLAQYQQVLRTIRYNNTAQNPTPTARNISFVVNDGASSSAIATSTVTILPVNDAPVLDLNGSAAGINFSTTFSEDGGATPIVSSTLSLSDLDNPTLTSATVGIRNLSDANAEVLSANTTGTTITAAYNPVSGVLELSGADTIANYQQVLRTVSYTNTSQRPTTTSRLIDFTVNDGTASSALATTTVKVVSVNDLPVVTLTGTPVTYTENGASVLVDSSIQLSDADHTTLQRATVRITNFVSGQDSLSFTPRGVITGRFSGGVLTLTGAASLADYQAVLQSVTYRNSSDRPSLTPRTIEFVVNDGQSNSLAASSTVAIATINDAPTLNTSRVKNLTAINEDTLSNPGTLISTLISTSVSDSDANALQGIAVTSALGAGRWEYSTSNGSSWTDFGAVSGSNALLLTANMLVRFSPDLNFNGAVSFSYRAWDQTSGIAESQVDTSNTGGTTAFSTAIATSSLTVNPVNDAPVNAVPSAQAINEDTFLIFSAATGNPITISDLDAGSNAVRITLATSNGTIRLSSINGLSGVTGNGTATLNATGSLTSLNTALNGLRFTPIANFSGTTDLIITTNDLGNRGSGGTLSDRDSISITVNPINDAPVNTLPNRAQSIQQGASLTFSSATGNRISISDLDAGTGIEQINLSVTNGTLALGSTSGLTTIAGNNTRNVTVQGTLLSLNSALNGLQFIPDASSVIAGTVTLTINTNDLGSTGAGEAKTDTDAFAIAVTPTNPITGTAGNNALNGTMAANFMRGLAGNDTLYGNGGNDILLSGDGNDVIYSAAGDDFINGGLGDDTIWLGGGQDTVVLASGNGSDTVYNYASGSTRFKLDAGLTVNNLEILQAGSNTLIRTTTGEQLASLIGTQANSITASSFV